jgi:hypothetical protein
VRRKALATSDFRLPAGYSIPLIALALCTWIASHATSGAWLMTAVLWIAGLLLYRLARSWTVAQS